MANHSRGNAVSEDEIVLRIWATPRSVRDARRAIGEFCRSGGLTSLATDAELLTSELVTNSCSAVDGLITVVLLRDEAGVVVTVTDDDTSEVTAPAICPPALADAGRGLYLVEHIASDWGTSRYRYGKTVWFRLDRG
jgi:anti-sigma regulatory factor (Ser/Thr protein kinase)